MQLFDLLRPEQLREQLRKRINVWTCSGGRPARGRVVRRGGRNERRGAEGSPSGTVSLIMSYTAGVPTSLAAHSVASFTETELEQSVAVENLLGALGTIATTGMLGAGPTGIRA